ncbi:hypothetical protein FACS1894172_04680 [Spirochaetia bacterium]|nr:hypothetical protein FACS1894172_04680 [Spirochaetia bacterium]
MKAILVLVLAFLVAGSGFSQDTSFWNNTANHQKIYPVNSEFYQALKFLYISNGLPLPSTTGPWSGDELLLMLYRLDPDKLQQVELKTYDFIEKELTQDHPYFNFDGHVNVEMYAHTNPNDFTALEDYIRPYTEAKPMIGLDFEGFVTPYVYGFGNISIGNNFIDSWVTKDDGRERTGSSLLGQTVFGTNIIGAGPRGINSIDLNFPKRAFISLGGRGLSFQVGRERLSWGAGESGNFIVGNNLEYHNVARAAFYSNTFKYTFSVSSFGYPGEYYSDPTTGGFTSNGVQVAHPGPSTAYDSTKGVNLFIGHRFEWRIVNKVNFIVTEGLMYQTDGTLDILAFSPLMLLHNMYRVMNGNSMLGFEVDWTIIPKLNVYASLAIDEFSMPGEAVPGKAAEAFPTAFGYMLGAKTAFPLGGRMFTGSLEFAYTDLYLYLRRQQETGSVPLNRRGLNYVVANRYFAFGTGGDAIHDEQFLGYRWGGDAIAINVHAGWRDLGKWNVEANILTLIHGTFDKWTIQSRVGPNGSTPTSGSWDGNGGGIPANQTTPTTSHTQPNYTDSDTTDRNAPYTLFAFSVLGSWNIFQGIPGVKNLAVYGQFDLVTIANPGNIKNAPAITDFQFTLGATYSF